jgi:aspartyl/asparaginyl beta-hydroxylase (cupin superfamily)
LNRFFDLYTGGKKRPVFFDIQKTYPALLALERNYPVIREELEAILPQKNAMPKYHELDVLQYHISAGGGENKDWKVFMLYAMGRKPESNRALCPRTCALLDQIPNLFEAFFSILDGGKSIPAHPGPYRGYLRYHLGLKVPEKNPPTIRVKDQYYTWKEGESILFDDSWEHEVYNHSDDVRVVLIVDVLRPLPPLPHAINRLAQPVIGFFYARGILGLSEMVQKLSHFLRRRFKPRRSPNSGAA